MLVGQGTGVNISDGDDFAFIKQQALRDFNQQGSFLRLPLPPCMGCSTKALVVLGDACRHREVRASECCEQGEFGTGELVELVVSVHGGGGAVYFLGSISPEEGAHHPQEMWVPPAAFVWLGFTTTGADAIGPLFQWFRVKPCQVPKEH